MADTPRGSTYGCPHGGRPSNKCATLFGRRSPPLYFVSQPVDLIPSLDAGPSAGATARRNARIGASILVRLDNEIVQPSTFKSGCRQTFGARSLGSPAATARVVKIRARQAQSGTHQI
jgi:hypothetical protein